jgi:hypothetical protein
MNTSSTTEKQLNLVPANRVRLPSMSAKAIEEAGLVIGLLGALIVAWGSLTMVLASRSYQGPSEADHRKEKWAHLIGSIGIAIGFAGTLWRLIQR